MMFYRLPLTYCMQLALDAADTPLMMLAAAAMLYAAAAMSRHTQR